ncbi:ATP-binding protein [Candidatus Nitrosotenuis sp. DW1]|uniref:ATP-binding protein n=1 Tax=Candidatus Nitrosotenuis sp. DW1 TaxID=2259672 RepID=UPI0015C92E9A|nr:ATP-binding protein [Candidatus Nitrosotenuis sp. DW1]
MKIRTKILLISSILVVLSVGLTSYFTFQYTEETIAHSAIHKMTTMLQEKKNQVDTLHARATEDLVYTLKNPLFEEYFDLPETKSGDVYKDGVLQLTQRQRELKGKLEHAIYNFQEKFQVDETCLIDTSGQEHARLVLTKTAPDEDLSSEESSAPFFSKSFQMEKHQVHVQYPYVSPDTNRWVFAYASPVVLGNGQKPAIFHFEMPMSIFQDLIKVSDGRMYVIDPKGLLVADSEYQFKTDSLSLVPENYFPPVFTVSDSDEFKNLVSEMRIKENGVGTYRDAGELRYVVYEKLPTFDWILVYEMPHSLILSGNETLDHLRTTIVVVGMVMIIAAFIAIFFISAKLSSPIRALIRACLEQNIHDPKPIEISVSDEIKDITNAINSMVAKISDNNKSLEMKNQEILLRNTALESEKAKTEALNAKLQDNMVKLEEAQYELEQQRDHLRDEVRQKTEELLKAERLSAIGQLAARIAHDLRNPLTVVQNTSRLLQTKFAKRLDDKDQENLARLDRAVYRMAHQLEDVLDCVRIPQLKKKDCSLSAILKDVMGRIDVPPNVTINIPCNDSVVFCDPEKMEIVFVNLLINAIQAIEDRAGTIDVEIHDDPVNNNFAIIKVIDSGFGIPQDGLQKIFEPLFTTKQSGTGLGLSSCKNIIEHHGGTIIVSSVVGKGTTFTLRIPKFSEYHRVPKDLLFTS